MPAPIPIRYPSPPLTDGAIVLRPWVAGDLEALVAICDDPDVARFTPLPAPYTDADGRTWLGADLGRMQAGEELSLAIHEAGRRPGRQHRRRGSTPTTATWSSSATWSRGRRAVAASPRRPCGCWRTGCCASGARPACS